MRHYKHAFNKQASILMLAGTSMGGMSAAYDFTDKTQRIRFAITESGHTPSSVSRLIGCEPAAIYQWLSGSTKNLKEPLLWALADVTGFEARWISMGIGPMKLPPSTRRAIDTLKAMEPEAQYTVSQVIETLSKPHKETT